MNTKQYRINGHRYLLIVLTVLAGVALAGCGNRTPDPVSLTIDMTEYAFTPNQIELQVGQEVTLNLTNSGALEHEFMIGRGVLMVDGKPTNYQTDFFEQAGVEPMVMMSAPTESDDHEADADDHEAIDSSDDHGSHAGFMVRLPQGDQQATVNFTVTEDMVGEWEIGCFLLESVHYTSGMQGKLIVKS